MNYENGFLQINHLVGEILLLKYEDQPEALTLSTMEDAEYEVVCSVGYDGVERTLANLKKTLKDSQDTSTRNYFEKKYNVYLGAGMLPIHEDLVELKDRFHETMRLACESCMVASGLKIIRNHSLFGVAYYQAAEEVRGGRDEFFFPAAEDIFRQFRKIILKFRCAGFKIPEEYNKFL